MTAEDHLRRLVDAGCDVYDFRDETGLTSVCFHCECDTILADESKHKHKSDCAYANAEKFIAQKDASHKALKELADSIQDFRPTTWG